MTNCCTDSNLFPWNISWLFFSLWSMISLHHKGTAKMVNIRNKHLYTSVGVIYFFHSKSTNEMAKWPKLNYKIYIHPIFLFLVRCDLTSCDIIYVSGAQYINPISHPHKVVAKSVDRRITSTNTVIRQQTLKGRWWLCTFTPRYVGFSPF